MQNLDKYNFHSHTTRCGHASGLDEEYISRAISEGFKYYGMSDHVMFPFLDQPGIRGNYDSDFQSYIDSFNSLKSKYKNKIDLHLGMEVEYSPLLHNYYQDLLKNKLEYLIMGQHFHMESNYIFRNYGKYENSPEKYVDDVILGMESGLILYVAHPDQLSYYYNTVDSRLESLCYRIVNAAKRTGTPLELNVSKVEYLRAINDPNPEQNAAFPLDNFWRIVGKEKIDVVIGLDTHNPFFVSTSGFNYALQLIDKYQLKVLSAEDIIERMKKIKEKLK